MAPRVRRAAALRGHGRASPPPGATPEETEEREARTAVGPLDVRRHRVGFRTVRLDMLPDEHDGEPGTSFVILVNDQPVFVRGANWIPDDAFPTA